MSSTKLRYLLGERPPSCLAVPANEYGQTVGGECNRGDKNKHSGNRPTILREWKRKRNDYGP